MRLITFAALCLAAGVAAADTTAVVKVYGLDVKERLQSLELIDVTAEKPAAEDAQPLDDELQAILDEAQRLDSVEQNADL
jgi:hypothetical protein